MPDKPPIGYYFIRGPFGPDDEEHRFFIKDQVWKVGEDMSVKTDIFALNPGATKDWQQFGPIEVWIADGGSPAPGAHPTIGGIVNTTVTVTPFDNHGHLISKPDIPVQPDYTKHFQMSDIKRVINIPIGNLELVGNVFGAVKFKKESDTDPDAFLMPIINYQKSGIFPSIYFGTDPLFHALGETLFDENDNPNPPYTFFMKKGDIPRNWFFQEKLDTNLPLGEGTAQWRWIEQIRPVFNGPWQYTTVLMSGGFGSDGLPDGSWSNVLNIRQFDLTLPWAGSLFGIVTTLQYSPDGVNWPAPGSSSGWPPPH